MAIAQKRRRASRSARPTSCAARWARRRSPSSTSSTRASTAGMTANGYSDAAVKTLWDILLPFSDYAFNKAHSAAYGVISLLDRLPQGALSRRVHGRAAHERRRREGQARGLPQRVPPHGHQGAAARRQRVDPATSPPSARTSASGWAPCATSARTSSTRSSRRARRRRASSRSTTSSPRCPSTSRTSAPSSRSSRRAPSTRSAPTRRALMEIHEDAVEAAVEVKRKEANGAIGFDFDSLYDETEEPCRPRCPIGRSGPRRTSSRSSARCSGSTCPTTRSPGSRSPLAKHASTSIHDLLGVGGRRATATR